MPVFGHNSGKQPQPFNPITSAVEIHLGLGQQFWHANPNGTFSCRLEDELIVAQHNGGHTAIFHSNKREGSVALNFPQACAA